jgi:EF-hand domain-containing protein 1
VQVLRFFAFFKESVHSSAMENYRVRRCILYYYLEDGSLHIAEPKVENSGIPQGVFVKRHRVPLEGAKTPTPIGIEHLFIGAELKIYGRVFRLVDADPATRVRTSGSEQRTRPIARL